MMKHSYSTFFPPRKTHGMELVPYVGPGIILCLSQSSKVSLYKSCQIQFSREGGASTVMSTHNI